MHLRRARPDELDDVGEVTVAAYADFVPGPDDPYLDHLRDAARRDREAELWVAVDREQRVQGSVTICPEGSAWREIARPGEGEFRMLSVRPSARGAGVGSGLVDLVLRRFGEEGASAVVMSSLAEMTAAHRLYERAGFTRMPQRDWSPLPHVHLIAFGKEL